MTAVEIRIEPEEIESLEIALRALYAEQACIELYWPPASRLSLAIDDLSQILSRIQHQRDQQQPHLADPWSRRVPTLRSVS